MELAIEPATSIILKLIGALAYIHKGVSYNNEKKTITHRDIKPSNIILSAKNWARKEKIDGDFLELVKQNKSEPYLIDFGIAKFKEDAKNDSGTLAYLSPAQAGCEYGRQDWRTDVYQLLLVYYELLRGKNPYAGISRSEIILAKKNEDFKISDKHKLSKPIRNLIEKGMKRHPKESFKSEKQIIKALSKIRSRQRKIEFVKRHKKPIAALLLAVLIISLSFAAYRIWDYQTKSTDALIKKIESNPNPSTEELQQALYQIQARAFEKKYYDPLLRGEYRDKATGSPLYPSHLDAKGNWVLEGPSTESAGAFTGLLFNYADRYPGLLNFSIEYAEPILKVEYDGSNEGAFIYGLVPAYEKTKDRRYLKKLINVSDNYAKLFNARKGSNLRNDMYLVELNLWLYNQTNEKKYLDFSKSFMLNYIKNNIDYDGYVYEVSNTNATSPYGHVPDSKWNRLVTPVETHAIGNYYVLSEKNKRTYKNVTSMLSRDFLQGSLMFRRLYLITNNPIYKNAINKTSSYYASRLPYDKTDYLFVSYLNKKNNIPKDTLADVKAIHFFKISNKEIYHQKLKAILSSKYFREEKENGILQSSVLIQGSTYDHSDATIKNQTLMITDTLFLEIK